MTQHCHETVKKALMWASEASSWGGRSGNCSPRQEPPTALTPHCSSPIHLSYRGHVDAEKMLPACSWESKACCCPSPGSFCKTQAGTAGVEQPDTFPCPPAALWENPQADLSCKGSLAPQGGGNAGRGQWFSLWLWSAPILANAAPSAAPCAAL